MRHSVTPTDLIQLLQTYQHISRFAPVRRPEDPGELKLIDDAGRPPIPDAHSPLQQRRGPQLVLDADLRSLPEHRVSFAGSLLPAPRSLFAGLLPLFERAHLLVDAGTRRRGD